MKPQINVVGLGPGRPDLLTREAWSLLQSAKQVYCRTSEHPAVSGLPETISIHSFDSLYDAGDDFEQVYREIVDQIVEIAKNQGEVVYAVPGDPHVGESTVLGLMSRAEREGLQVRIIPGVSFIEPCLHQLGVDALDGLQVADAFNLAETHHPHLSPDQPALIAQVFSRLIAADVKLTLLNQYPEDHQVRVIEAAGSDLSNVISLPLVELDRLELFSNLTTLYIPPLEHASAFESFQETVAHLRAPDGCPWDREQTHETLRMHLMEECYEALQAIDDGNLDALKEELGDLTLQIVLHAQIATEAGRFRMTDVLADINDKIIRRHPHVFEDLELDGVPDVLHNWETLKAEEREVEGNDKGLLDGVPIGLPALTQANELQSRAARVGFDWSEVDGVLEKVREEISEVLGAETDRERESELGDLLFALVNYARWVKVDPESALRGANSRFRKRFAHVEHMAKSKGKRLSEMSLEELDQLWEHAKSQ